MTQIELWIRSILFNLAFYLWTFLFTALFSPVLLFDRSYAVRSGRFWTNVVAFLLRTIARVDYRVEGKEYLKTTPLVVAAKHQSAWDTLIYLAVLRDPSMILKKELTYIPLYGWFIRKFDMIHVDRSKGSQALRTMLTKAKADMKAGRPLLIFPEGTRSEPGQAGEYKSGITALYNALQAPIVPVAVNSGLFWGRHTFLRKPGTIILRCLPPIQAGFSKKEFIAELETRIEKESLKLFEKGRQELKERGIS